jgi:hypothetical protein
MEEGEEEDEVKEAVAVEIKINKITPVVIEGSDTNLEESIVDTDNVLAEALVEVEMSVEEVKEVEGVVEEEVEAVVETGEAPVEDSMEIEGIYVWQYECKYMCKHVYIYLCTYIYVYKYM